MLIQEIQDLIVRYILTDESKIKAIDCGRDILEQVEEDAVQDMKDQMWEMLLQELDYTEMMMEIEEAKLLCTDEETSSEE